MDQLGGAQARKMPRDYDLSHRSEPEHAIHRYESIIFFVQFKHLSIRYLRNEIMIIQVDIAGLPSIRFLVQAPYKNSGR